MLSAFLVALAPAPLPPGALSEDAFTELLETGTRQELIEGCKRVISLGLDQRLRQLRQTLLMLNTETSSLAVVFADTRALLRCKAPDAALQVLERISPNVGPERQEWLLLQWRAASDGLDQRRAALALDRLSEGSAEVLDAQLLTLAEPQAPSELPIQRSALDVQADQLEAMGHERAAIELLLQEGQTAQLTAQRRQRAATLLAAEGEPEQAAEIAGAAVDVAASASAWGLSGALLDDQRRYQLAAADLQGAEQTNARRLRLGRRLADGMGERAAVLSAIADQTSDPALAQQLLDRRDPLERRRGALLDVLLSLDAPAQEGPDERLARLDLAVQVAQRLGHQERLMDLLLLQERETRVRGKTWLRDRVTTLAMKQSGGNPARRLQALYRRQRALLEDPVLPLIQRQIWDSKQEQERLLALKRQEQVVAEQDRQLGFAPFPVTYRLPALFEDLARLAQAQPPPGEELSLPPAVFGVLPQQLPPAEAASMASQLRQALQTMGLSDAVIAEGTELFRHHVQRLARREWLQAALSADLDAEVLSPQAVQRRAEWLALEQELDSRSESLRALARFGRSAAGLQALAALHQQEDLMWSGSRQQELQRLPIEILAAEAKLQSDLATGFQLRAVSTPPEQAAIALSEQWELFTSNPTADSATELQQQAAAANQDALELEALRFRLASLLPAGVVEPLLLEQLRGLELRLRSPQSRGGHLGPPSSSR
ncbi:Conserved hypothetical protein [Synechococcus sp. RCC307]|nr:Conserved hypothetical protein [Synechococcus sp. RCC307]